jgi:hypothetical protein
MLCLWVVFLTDGRLLRFMKEEEEDPQPRGSRKIPSLPSTLNPIASIFFSTSNPLSQLRYLAPFPKNVHTDEHPRTGNTRAHRSSPLRTL